MGEPRKLSEMPPPTPGTSALATWGLWRRIVKSPERLAEWRAQHPEQAAAEDRAIEEARAAARAAAPQPQTAAALPREELARRMRALGAPEEPLAGWLAMYGTPALEFVAPWVRKLELRDRPRMLVLTGDTGSGKTVAALEALAWALRRKDRGPAHYTTLRAALALGRWGEDGERWDAAMEARMLVLDELVGEGLDRYRLERADELLCRRYEHGRPTVITTNLAPALLLDSKGPFGARVASRLGDERACRIVGCGTVDLRKGKR